MKLFSDNSFFLNPEKLPVLSNDERRLWRLKLINYFFVFSLPVFVINDLVQALRGIQPYTFEKFPVLIFWLVNLLAFWLTRKKKYMISKLIVIFSPLAFMSSYAMTGYIIGEHFLWQPIVLIGLSIIPFMVLDLQKEKLWVVGSFLLFLIYLIFHDKIMLSGVEDDDWGLIFTRLNTTPFIYNTVRIVMFVFLTALIYLSIRSNEHQQKINEDIQQSLQETTRRLEKLNAELEAQRNAINKSASLITTDKTSRIISVNDNFLSATGYTSDELLGMEATEMISKGNKQSFFKEMEETINKGEVWRGEMKIDRKENGHVWMSTAISTINYPDPNKKGYLIIMFDITKLKDDEERLEKLNFEKDRILYAVAHDLKNPLLNFKALLGILNSGTVKDEKEEQEIYKLMSKDCEHSTNLISELLDIGRLEDENYILEKEPVNLKEFIEQSLEPFEKAVRKKQLRLTKIIDARISEIPLNKQEFQRVISNLFSNAIKFTPSGGEITIAAGLFDDGRVAIKISDSGIGISADLLPIIFDKFSKARRKGIEGEKSTGLGMWIVKHIVKLHGGEISVESAEDKGTTFTITLPVRS